MHQAIADQVKLFGEQAQAWKMPQGDSAAELEDRLAFGIFLFDRLRELDEQFRFSVTEPNQELDTHLLSCDRQWGKAANNCLAALADLESKGFSIRYAAAFRQRCLEARGILATEIAYQQPARECSQTETLDELLARVTDENRHGEINFGPPVGKEVW
jgi:hypothetical protein